MPGKGIEEPTHSTDENNNGQKKEIAKWKKQNKEKIEDNTQKKDNTEHNAEKGKAKEVEDTTDLTDETEWKTRNLLVGTSNLKFISTQQLSDKKVKVDKVIKYTLDEGQKYIDSLKKKEDKMDVIVLHLFENDIAEQIPEQCMEKLSKMTNDIKRKLTDVKVILSLGLPQWGEGINMKISKLNVLLTEKLGDVNYVSLCDNGNLF